ncbi:MAG: hypothetical protein U0325_31750 [Polyangiales bacterium]
MSASSIGSSTRDDTPGPRSSTQSSHPLAAARSRARRSERPWCGPSSLLVSSTRTLGTTVSCPVST